MGDASVWSIALFAVLLPALKHFPADALQIKGASGCHTRIAATHPAGLGERATRDRPMCDRKNINKSALSREKVLISVDGNGSLRAVFHYAATGRKEFITRLSAAFGNLS